MDASHDPRDVGEAKRPSTEADGFGFPRRAIHQYRRRDRIRQAISTGRFAIFSSDAATEGQ
jgi:hypothetical protein